MLVLGIETSCDETGIALYDTVRGLRAHALHTQVALHAEYGGVVPELASRDHIRRVLPLTRQVLAQGAATLPAVIAAVHEATGVWFNEFLLRQSVCCAAWEKSSRMPVQKRILVLTADVGFGHRSAANAIPAALEDSFADLCTVEVINPLDDRRTPTFLRNSQTEYDKFVRQMPNFWKLNYEISSSRVPAVVVERALTALLFSVIRSIVKSYSPAAIVCTHPFYLAPLNVYLTLLNLPIPYLTVVTDLTHIHRLWFNRGADYLLLPTQEAFQQNLTRHFSADRVQVTGVPVNPAFVVSLSDRMAKNMQGWYNGNSYLAPDGPIIFGYLARM